MTRRRIPFVVQAEDVIAFNIYTNWSRVKFGFGQAQACRRTDGAFEMSDECLGAEAVREIMHAAVDAVMDKIAAQESETSDEQ